MTCALNDAGSVTACPSSIEYVMDVTGWDWHDSALAVSENGDVTLAPSRGATTEMPEFNFAVTDGGGMEHPVIANARKTPVEVNNVPGLGFRTIQQILARVRMSALAYISELDLGVKRSRIG